MDKNKLQVLRDVGFQVQRCCGICANGEFPNNDWGTCGLQVYDHLKHGNQRKLSVHKAGSCDRFELSETADLGGFKEFLNVDRGTEG